MIDLPYNQQLTTVSNFHIVQGEMFLENLHPRDIALMVAPVVTIKPII